ncbi:MAG: 4-hydroxy-tetrahydrodipicolinate synthase [Candidatus Cloacimonadales bacterium]
MLKGSFVALVTPFKNNDVDYNALETLIEFHIEKGTDGILLMGTTGEAPNIASDERDRMLQFCIQKIDGRVEIMVGTGTNNYHQTISLTKKAERLGVNYALVITPYYIKPTQKSLYEYFKIVADSTTMPVVIYNVPGRTGVNINSDTTIKLAKACKNIVGIKEASGDILQASRIVRDTDKNFSVMSGEDALNIAMYAVGCKGTISVTANIIPDKVHMLWALCMDNKMNEARKLHEEILELNNMMFIETNPIPVKEALAMMGMIEQEIRLPLTLLEDKSRELLRETLIRYKLIKI